MDKSVVMCSEEAGKLSCLKKTEDESMNDYLTQGKSFYKEESQFIKFVPPVYFQRYSNVVSSLQDPRWKGSIRKVVDMGCGELGFFLSLKHFDGMREIVAVDIDHELLENNSCKIVPLTADFLRFRNHDLVVSVVSGSVAEYDKCLEKSDAVICIELIEHLFPPDLEALPYNILEKIKPRVAIFTTPNADFNLLFPNLGNKFRHPDHKFEWSREQFEDWANNLIVRYPDYNVEFKGIGKGPGDTEKVLGCCSQMAIFWRHAVPELISEEMPEELYLNMGKRPRKMVKQSTYRVVRQCIYPARVDERSPEVVAQHETDYQLFLLSNDERFEDVETGAIFVPLSELLVQLPQHFSSEAELKCSLKAAGKTFRTMKNGSECVEFERPFKRDFIYLNDEEEEEEDEGCSNTWISPQQIYEEENWDEPEPWASEPIQEEKKLRSPELWPSSCETDLKETDAWWNGTGIKDCTSHSPDSDWEMAEATSRPWQSEPQLQASSSSPQSEDQHQPAVMFRSVNERQIFGFQRTYSSADEAIRIDDSGYPNSASVQDMDVTLGSSDELSSNSGSSGSSSPVEDHDMPRVIPAPPVLPHFRPEPIPANNHDAVNNNRDGEGNDLGLEVPHQPRPQPPVPPPFPRWMLLMLADERDEGFAASSSEDEEEEEEEEDRHIF